MDLPKILKCSFRVSNVSFVRRLHVSKLSATSLRYSPNSKLSKPLFDRYLCLPQPDCKAIIEYIWIDGSGYHLRSKARTLNYIPSSYKEIPNWSIDGSLVGLAKQENPDITLVPIALYSDPVRRGKNKLVMCETYDNQNKPSKTNHRTKCMEALNEACKHQSCFGFEQDIMLKDVDKRPFGWPVMLGEPTPTEPYFCTIGGRKVYGRDIMEAFYRSCLYCGIDIYGMNSERMPSKWEFQTGPTQGIKAGDDLWVARYLLARIAEEYGLEVSLNPKPFTNWPALGCHVNFSTKKMRDDNGLKAIEEAVKQLEGMHKGFLEVYDPKGGKYNKLRLDGKYEVSNFDKFTSGSDRCKSLRIPPEVTKAGKGYLEDRRPASNVDPYQCINVLVRSVCLGDAACAGNKSGGGDKKEEKSSKK